MEMSFGKNAVIFVIGVSGVGKSTIGKLIAENLSIPFFDGDDYHPQANVDKMSNRIPLNDNDREGWLTTLNQLAKEQLKTTSCVIACSALKKNYRDRLNDGILAHVKWVHLAGSFECIAERIKQRENHYMPVELLNSQFAILEKPVGAIEVDINLTPNEILKKIMEELLKKSEFGLFGLGVMGKSLCRNLAKNGFHISMFNRHVDGVEENVAANFKNKFEELASAQAFDNIELFVQSIQQPRKIMLMVNAGKITDMVINDLVPYLEEGDIIIDGGNSNYKNSKERFDVLKSKNIHFISAGVSGGEAGALKGPSIMPSGNEEVFKSVAPYLNKIAAKDDENLPCCTYIGTEGSGHFVKMVHNGIEYVEMQLLAEVFNIFQTSGQNLDEIANILEGWKISADSYLLDITTKVLRKKDGNDWLVNKIVDKAGNKGTGNWTTITTAELGVPATLIPTALFARYSSFFKEERVLLNEIYKTKNTSKSNFEINDVLNAYRFARIINHFQGIKLISEASKVFNWQLNLSEIARIWTNGCIIKSDLMKELVSVLKTDDNILLNPKISSELINLKPSINKIVSKCILNDIAIPCLSEALNYFNAYTNSKSPANLIQAQRDFFGAHTYQRIDDLSGKFHHTNWE